MRTILTIALSSLALVACGGGEPVRQSADTRQAQQTAEIAAEADARIGTPGITNFTERRWVRYLYELRDETFTTYSYYMDLQGDLHFLCESIGYGINASIQFTNPERVAHRQTYQGGSYGTLPQPEPNGLFMPEGLAATYVLCSDGQGGIAPVYWEPELIVSPFPLRHVGDVRAGPVEPVVVEESDD